MCILPSLPLKRATPSIEQCFQRSRLAERACTLLNNSFDSPHPASSQYFFLFNSLSFLPSFVLAHPSSILRQRHYMFFSSRIQNSDLLQAARVEAALGGAAGRRGTTERRQNGSSRRQPFSVPSKTSKTHVLKVCSKVRTSEIPCKPMEEHNERLTRRTTAALRSRLLTSGPTIFVFCFYFCKIGNILASSRLSVSFPQSH